MSFTFLVNFTDYLPFLLFKTDAILVHALVFKNKALLLVMKTFLFSLLFWCLVSLVACVFV